MNEKKIKWRKEKIGGEVVNTYYHNTDKKQSKNKDVSQKM